MVSDKAAQTHLILLPRPPCLSELANRSTSVSSFVKLFLHASSKHAPWSQKCVAGELAHHSIYVSTVSMFRMGEKIALMFLEAVNSCPLLSKESSPLR